MQRKLLYTAVLMLNTIVFSSIAKTTKHTSTLPVKIGYIDLYAIIDQLPDMRKMEAEISTFKKQLEAQLRVESDELGKKMQALDKEKTEAMTEIIKKQKAVELEQLLSKYDRMKLELNQKIAKKTRDMYLPIYEKVKSAIAQIAQEHNYTHILNSPGVKMGMIDILLYADEMCDVSKLVLKKLGVDPDGVTK